MKPFLHARGSVSRWGGKPEDYMAIHDFIDSSKATMPDVRHRALYHHALGCYLVERIFGHTFINSDGREVSTRDVAEHHIIEDMGFLPSVEDWIDGLPLAPWHGGISRMPKDQRPKSFAEVRAETRKRVLDILFEHGHGTYFSQYAEDYLDEILDDIITTVRGEPDVEPEPSPRQLDEKQALRRIKQALLASGIDYQKTDTLLDDIMDIVRGNHPRSVI